MKKLLFAVVGLAAASAMADLEITGDYLITSGRTISEKVTGTGRFIVGNGATLKLSNSHNDFTGGIVISNGIVQVEASNAMGTGDIVFRCCPTTSPAWQDSDRYYRQLYLYASGGVWSNNIVFLDRDCHSSFPGIRAWKTGTLAGNITATDSDTRTVYMSADANVRLTFEGDVTVKKWYDTAKGRLVMKGKITSDVFQHGSGSSDNGTMELWNPANAIGSFTMKAGSVECMAANVLYGTKISWSINSWWMSGNWSQLRLNGYDQAVGGIHDDTSAAYMDHITMTDKTTSVITPDDKPATVTIMGTAANWWPTTIVRYFGPIDIVGNRAVSGYTCVPRSRWVSNWGMTGTLATSNTTFYIEKGASFSNAVAMVAAKGGTFSFGSVTNAIVAAKKIDIAGTLYCDTGCVAPINAPKAEMTLADDAVLQFKGAVTNTVKYLVVGGKYQEPGVYTKANLTQMSKSDATAALVVLKKKHGFVLIVQ